MSLPENEVQALAWALIDEALETDEEYVDGISIDHLKRASMKHQELVENLNIR